jgi:AcrR family transcriptional regulator
VPRPLPPAVVAATGNDIDAIRRHIMEATWRVIANEGLTAASTRAIAEEAGISGGTLYNYFENHVQLVAKSIINQAQALADPVAALPSRAGQSTVEVNLRYFVRKARAVLDELVPTLAAAFSDRDLLDAVRHEMTAVDPLIDPVGVVERYLLAERRLGRIAPHADCSAAASIMTSMCHDDAFQRYLQGTSGKPTSRNREIEFIARSLTE